MKKAVVIVELIGGVRYVVHDNLVGFTYAVNHGLPIMGYAFNGGRVGERKVFIAITAIATYWQESKDDVYAAT